MGYILFTYRFFGLLTFLVLTYLLNFQTATGIILPFTVGAYGLGVVFQRRKKSEEYWDERDKEIERSAYLTGLWIYFFYNIAVGYYSYSQRERTR